MPTLEEVLSNLKARDELQERDVRSILEYTDQEVGTAGDNLGDHTATEPLQMQSFGITGVPTLANAGNMQMRPDNSGGLGSQITILAGTGGGGGAGGALFLQGGQGNGAGNGGLITILGGQSSTGTGGVVTVQAGHSSAGSNKGGTLILEGGESDNGDGGDVQIVGGIAGLNDSGGSITITASDANGAATGGSVTITAGGGGGTRGVVNIEDGNGVNVGRFDEDNTALNTRFMLYDVDNATLERVSVGTTDSGGAGFKLLRIPN